MSTLHLRSLVRRSIKVLKAEVDQIRPRQHVFSMISRAIPHNTGNELRASLLRLRSIHVGAGTLVFDTPRLTGGEARDFSNLGIGTGCIIGVGCTFEVGSTITIGNDVTLGHGVLVITTTHEIGPRENRAGNPIRRPVTIEDGASIGARCVILPGVIIGAHSTVEAGSVVNTNVAPQSRVRGIPARRIVESVP
jgi:maltose O-acetyltransferase